MGEKVPSRSQLPTVVIRQGGQPAPCLTTSTHLLVPANVHHSAVVDAAYASTEGITPSPRAPSCAAKRYAWEPKFPLANRTDSKGTCRPSNALIRLVSAPPLGTFHVRSFLLDLAPIDPTGLPSWAEAGRASVLYSLAWPGHAQSQGYILPPSKSSTSSSTTWQSEVVSAFPLMQSASVRVATWFT